MKLFIMYIVGVNEYQRIATAIMWYSLISIYIFNSRKWIYLPKWKKERKKERYIDKKKFGWYFLKIYKLA